MSTADQVFIDSFSSSIGDLTRKQAHDYLHVLSVLARDPMVSAWDMDTHNVWRTIDNLKKSGFVQSIETPYPWLKFEITQLGKDELAKVRP